ncbi:MAG: aminoacetone oxidase family FAD-binding enzyme [Candidatus Omnitrophica bacterium]|nr:aminoacetone oxidase family FAD-binding enzyme [Candidatus Omnitrophota bacterium]
MIHRFKVVIVGGGASGIAAGISAGRMGDKVLICEKMPSLGKKILASGNGRCNLSNEDLAPSHYNSRSRDLVETVFSRFGKTAVKNFFSEIGVELYSEGGRVFPATNQSATVLRALEIELSRLAIPVELGFDVAHIDHSPGKYILISKSGKRVESEYIILACGGRSYPALGSDGSGFQLARRFNHSVIEPVPSCVPLVTKSPLCHMLQGQKIKGAARAIVGDEVVAESEGEVLFTKYGLSGTAIIDVSRPISIAINRSAKKDADVTLDMAPFIGIEELKQELSSRVKNKRSQDDMLVGILPNKFGPALKKILDIKNVEKTSSFIKQARFRIDATRGWNEADFTAGGVDVREVDGRTLESRLSRGLYLSGEVLDVDGERGGYNLAWAWASGYIAGLLGREERALTGGPGTMVKPKF